MKLVVLVSGGLDSYIAYRYGKIQYDNTIPMFVDYKQPYIDKEKSVVSTLFSNVRTVNCDLCNIELEGIPTLLKQEIPGRNLLLCFYGATIGDIVWLSSLSTEMNITSVRDKHPEFFMMTTALLTYIMKTKRNETVVESPFRNMTKSDVIKLGLSIGITIEELKSTSSCYHEKYFNCGECSTCFKRWVAMTNNGIEEEYRIFPYTNDYAVKVIEEAKYLIRKDKVSDRFSKERLLEMKSALEIVGINI